MLRKASGYEDEHGSEISGMFGDVILVSTFLGSILVILWAVSRDLTVALGRRRILHNLNRSAKPGTACQLFNNPTMFDSGVRTDMLYHFSAGVTEQKVQLYVDIRGLVGKGHQPLPSVDFWRGLKVLQYRRVYTYCYARCCLSHLAMR